MAGLSVLPSKGLGFAGVDALGVEGTGGILVSMTKGLLSPVDFLERAFFPATGLGGSSFTGGGTVPGVDLVVEVMMGFVPEAGVFLGIPAGVSLSPDMDGSFAGVLGTVGTVGTVGNVGGGSEVSAAEAESRFEVSS